MRRALWRVAGCCLLLAACGKDARTHVGVAGDGGAGVGGAGDSGANDATAAGARGAAAGDGGSAGSGRPDGCIDFSHFEDTMRMKWDLRVIGTGFEADEGNRVRVVVTYSGEPSYGLGETAIQNGSFDILLPGATEPYTGIGVYIDRDRDEACTLDVDSMWQKSTGGVYGEEIWEVTPDEPDPAGASPCIINGILDLTRPMSCP